MTIFWIDGTFTHFQEKFEQCEAFGHIGFYATSDGKKSLCFFSAIKYIN